MTEWFYEATPTKLSFEETRDLATNDGFICCSALEENGARADNTQHVAFRDVVHLYFTGGDAPAVIGSFEIVGPNRHPFRERFGKGVTGTALHEASDEFATRLRGLGDGSGQLYQPDPVLKKLTGWAVVRRENIVTPPIVLAPFHHSGGRRRSYERSVRRARHTARTRWHPDDARMLARSPRPRDDEGGGRKDVRGVQAQSSVA